MAPSSLQRPVATLSRRQFMTGATGLSFAFAIDRCDIAKSAVLGDEADGAILSPWVSIAPNGVISIMSPAAETDQGSMTSLPLILAEELDAEWDQVRVVPAPVIEKIYGNPAFGGAMFTAGSTAVSAYFTPLRTFGAQVRRVLLDNVAKKWNVPLEELTTEPSTVVHEKSGRRLSYGEIAAFAQIPGTAPEITPAQLKKTSEFRLIGRDVMRVELTKKVNGTAAYSIDLQIPGMIYGTVLESPVEGSTPEQFDEANVKAVEGVIATVRLPYGIGVLAETPWAAFDGKAAGAASITWKRSSKAWGFGADEGLKAFAAAARNPSVPALIGSSKDGVTVLPNRLSTAGMDSDGCRRGLGQQPRMPPARSQKGLDS